ncbi:MAG: GAF domain-containing protein [Novosphingobium sp.]|nr:GAF domain-containing protein [Novosphingobium sp.]
MIEHSQRAVEDVIITDELARRPSRAADLAAENRALARLAEAMIADPQRVLDQLAEEVMELTRSESAGISLLERGEGHFRWVAATGQFAPFRNGTMPRDASPCGEVVSRDTVLLFNEAAHIFPALRDVQPKVYENLLVPFRVEGEPAGTVWAIKHTPEGRFEREDARVLESLARFAAASFRLHSAVLQRDRFFDLSRDLLAIASTEDGTWKRVNPSFTRILGLSEDDLIGHDFAEYVHPDDQERTRDVAARLAAGEVVDQFEHRVLCKGSGYRVIQWHAATFPPQGEIYCVGRDVTQERAAQAARRDAEARQSFLLTLSDTIRTLVDPVAIFHEACRLLLEWLRADRASYVEFDPAADFARVTLQFGGEDGGKPSDNARSDDRAWALSPARTGQLLVIDDAAASGGISADERAALASLQLVAFINYPLRKDGEHLGAFCVGQSRPREWTDAEVELISETAERIWAAIERARAEAALRESQARLSAVFDGLPVAVGVSDRSRNFVLVNQAMTRFAPDNTMPSADGRRWRWTARHRDGTPLAADEFPGARALRGERVVPGIDMLYTDDSGREIWTSVAALPVRGAGGDIIGFVAVVSDIDALMRSLESQGTLLAELQHRVRNILAMIRSVVRRTGEGHTSLDDYVAHLLGRIDAMARTQVLLTRSAGADVDLDGLVREELRAQLAREAQFEISGPDVRLSPKAAEVVTLAMHELATNSLKYGALAHPEGRLRIGWKLEPRNGEEWLVVRWKETGIQLADGRLIRGFGTDLITRRVAYELKGQGTIDFARKSVLASIEFPLVPATSVLETTPSAEGGK